MRRLLLVVLLASAFGCSGPVVPPDIIWIVADTLRSDHLGCYGYEGETTPRIDAFAEGATRYSRAISSAPWTVPSHASMFTGKPPFAHGAHTFRVMAPSRNVDALRDEALTFAEALVAEANYRTGAFVANMAFLSPNWGLDQGFQSWTIDKSPAVLMNERIFEWLEARDERPSFLFVNYMDTHRPYNTAPDEFDSGPSDELFEAVLPGTQEAPEALLRTVVAQYDTSIRNLDEGVGQLLDRLPDDAIVIFTSDHGEYFGEHRLVGHSKDLYEPVMRVPLIVRGPGQTEGGVVDALTVSNDVPGLTAQLLPGELGDTLLALFPDLPGNHTVVAENSYTRRKDLFHPDWGKRFQRVRRAVYEWPLKLIDSSDGDHELFDLEADPDEARNLLEQRPDDVERLRSKLVALEAELGRPGTAPDRSPLSEEQRERLEALGYLGE